MLGSGRAAQGGSGKLGQGPNLKRPVAPINNRRPIGRNRDLRIGAVDSDRGTRWNRYGHAE